MALVENILSLEAEADSIVVQARAEAKEMEKSAIHEVEAYRRRLAEETDQKVRAFQKEAEEKHKRSVAAMEKDLARGLNDIDRIADDTLKRQVDRIVIKFSEM